MCVCVYLFNLLIVSLFFDSVIAAVSVRFFFYFVLFLFILLIV